MTPEFVNAIVDAVAKLLLAGSAFVFCCCISVSILRDRPKG